MWGSDSDTWSLNVWAYYAQSYTCDMYVIILLSIQSVLGNFVSFREVGSSVVVLLRYTIVLWVIGCEF